MTRAARFFAMRAAFVIGAAMLAMFFAARAHAATTPIQFVLEQEGAYKGTTADPQQIRAKHHFKGQKTALSAPPQIRSNSASPDIIRAAESTLGLGNFTGMRGAWCAWAVSAWLRMTGRPPLASGMAYSALYYGPRLPGPVAGALIVLPHHVGLVAAVHGASVTMISGNYGHRVRLAEIPARRALAFIAIP